MRREDSLAPKPRGQSAKVASQHVQRVCVEDHGHLGPLDESRDERRYANMPLIRDLLPIWDNVGRAIEAAEQHEDTNSLLEGFKMVAQQFVDVLKSHSCTEIESLHEPFDPHLHEAISQQPSGDYPGNIVLHVVQTGFLLHDRVVRPTQVIVSVDVPPPANDNR